MNRKSLKSALLKKTHCTIHDGWPCRTCFFEMSKDLNNHDWQALLLYRGDHKESELDNLPATGTEASLKKILAIAEKRKGKP